MIGKAIYALLNGSTALTTIVSNRIFPDMATQTAVYPFVIYTVEGTTPTDTKDGVSVLDVVDVAVMAFANTYTQAQEVAGLVRTALDRVTGSQGGITLGGIRFAGQQGAQMDLDKHVYIIEQRYEVREIRER